VKISVCRNVQIVSKVMAQAEKMPIKSLLERYFYVPLDDFAHKISLRQKGDYAICVRHFAPQKSVWRNKTKYILVIF